MVTAPGTPHQLPSSRRPSSSMSSVPRRGLQMSSRDILTNTFHEQEEEHLMDGNPWAQHPIMKERNTRTSASANSVRLSSPSPRPNFGPGSSNSSSVTATPHNRPLYTPTSNHEPFQALGPATKRAVELLQSEVVTLNERIDDLRKELVERDKHRLIQFKKSERSNDKSNSNNTEDDGWKWVIKVSVPNSFLFNIDVSIGCIEIRRSQLYDSTRFIFNLVQDQESNCLCNLKTNK